MNALRHISLLLILFGIFAFAPSATANSAFQSADVRISTIGGDELSVSPGGVVTVVYSIESEGAAESGELTPKFDLPEGWGIVIGKGTISLKKGEPTIRFVTYRIPQNALSGDYSVKMTLGDGKDQAVSTLSTSVFVESMFSLSFEIEPFESFVPAGKSAPAVFHVANNGNSPISVDLSTMKRTFVNIDLPSETLALAPGESRRVEAMIHTDANLDHSINVGIRFDAVAKENQEQAAYANLNFDVIPVFSRVRPKAAQIPLSLGLETIGDETGFTQQAKLAGSIDALGGVVSVNAVIAEKRRDKFFGNDQAITVQYKTDDLTVKLGDHGQNLSPMTMTGERGIGAAVNLTAGKWQINSSVQKTRLSYPVQKRAGASLSRTLSPTSEVSANVLHRTGLYDGTVMTLRSVSKPFGPTSKLDFECGIDSSLALNDPSCAVQLSQSTARWSVRLKGNANSKTFPGSSAGARQFSEIASYRINRNLRADNSIQFLTRNMGQGYARSNAFFKAGVSYADRFNGGTLYATLHGVFSQTDYESLFERVNRTENTLRATVGYQLRSIGLATSYEAGSAGSSVLDTSAGLNRFKSSLRVNIRSGWSVNSSFDVSSGNLSSLGSDQKQTMLGLGTTFALPYGVAFSATAFKSAIRTGIEQQYASLRTRISKTFRSGHLLTVQGQFNQSSGRLDVRSSDYSISYSLPLYLPVGNNAEESTILKGQILDLVTGEPVPDALIFLGENLSISDSKGRFAIPRKLDRTEYLRVDQKSIGYDRVSTIPLPLEISPTDHQGSELILTLTASATLSGRIEILTFPGGEEQLIGASQEDLVVSGGLSGAIVQISSETQRFKTRTGVNGQFQFGQLPEGAYKVEIVNANLSAQQRIKVTSVNVMVEAGKDTPLVFKVTPVRKQVRIIKTSALSTGVIESVTTDEAARGKTDSTQRSDSPSTETMPDSTEYEESDAIISGDAKPAPSGSWLDLMSKSAQSQSADRRSGAGVAFLPFYVDVTTPPSGSSFVTPAYIFMLICSVLYLLVSIEQFIRIITASQQSIIRSLGKPSWIWAYRQSSIYFALIASSLYYFGMLGGFAVSLGLAGVSITIESKEQYKNLGAILYLLLKCQIRQGAWIAYQDAVAQVVEITVHTFTLRMHNGKTIELSPSALLHVSVSRWKPDEVRNEKLEISVSRLSNLRSIRHIASERLADFSPMRTLNHALIAFRDNGASETIVQIEVLIDGNRFTKSDVEQALIAEFKACGVELWAPENHELESEGLKEAASTQSVPAMRVVTSPALPNAGPGSRDQTYPGLRLIKGGDSKAA